MASGCAVPVSRIMASAPTSAAVPSSRASIRLARPSLRAAGATYIRLTSAVCRVPKTSTSSRSRQAPVATGTPSR